MTWIARGGSGEIQSHVWVHENVSRFAEAGWALGLQAHRLAMSLPRFELDDDENDDSTAPAQFVLKLPASYARKLAPLRPAPTPVPWIVETPPPPPSPTPTRAPTKLIAAVACIVALVIVTAGALGAVARTGEGPVGVSKRAPKSLDRSVRASAHQSAFTPRVATVSIESLRRAHARRRH